MNQEKALFQAILNSPDDDTPRLTYADWLDENGDKAHAKFIRALCLLEYASISEDERARLDRKTSKWIKNDSWKWIEKIRARVAYSCSFHRGFFDRLETLLLGMRLLRRKQRSSCVAHQPPFPRSIAGLLPRVSRRSSSSSE